MTVSEQATRVLAPDTAILVDTASGKKVPLWDRLVLGRNEGDQTFPEDSTMSGSHLRISKVGPSYFIEDLGSRNGTRINGRTLESGEKALLRENDLLEFGVQSYRFFASVAGNAARSRPRRSWTFGSSLIALFFGSDVYVWWIVATAQEFMDGGKGSSNIPWATEALPA